MSEKIDVAVIVGSSSDVATMSEATKTLDVLGLSYSVNIASAHRTVEHLKQCVEGAQSAGAKAFIAAAGMSAALPGAIAAQTNIPVIGVPMEGKNLASMDALFSIAQMPKGVPVAAMAVGKAGAINAAVFAARIIAISNDVIKEKLEAYRKKMYEEAIKEDLKLQKDGITKYVNG